MKILQMTFSNAIAFWFKFHWSLLRRVQRTLVNINADNELVVTSCQAIHNDDVIMGVMASQITSLTIVYSTVFFRHRSKKTSKLRVTGHLCGNSPGSGEFPAQMASNAENVSISWHHHVPEAIKDHVLWHHIESLGLNELNIVHKVSHPFCPEQSNTTYDSI